MVMSMRTEQRLWKAYKNARIETFDEKSKFIFFSDCHRSDGSLSDEFTRNQNTYLYALNYYYNQGYTYVEAGDGDELWEHPEFMYIRKAHYKVFELIKKFYDNKRLIMLYGNHNIYLRNKEYVKRLYYTFYNDYKEVAYDFLKGIVPSEALVLREKTTGQEILTVHGHQGDFANDQLWALSMLSLKYFWRFMHAFGANSPSSPVKNITRQCKIERNYNKWIERHKTMIICGHTHRYKFPRKDEPPYFNCGCCIYPDSITGIEIADNCIMSVRWRVVPNEEGLLQIVRDVIRGPEPLCKYDMRDDPSSCRTSSRIDEDDDLKGK